MTNAFDKLNLRPGERRHGALAGALTTERGTFDFALTGPGRYLVQGTAIEALD